MTAEELYLYTQDILNGNSTNKNAFLTRRLFVDFYNRNSIKYVFNLLNNRNSDELRVISNLRVEKELDKAKEGDISDEFYFPEDYLSFINISAVFSDETCSNMRSEVMKEVKPENIDIEYNDAWLSPSLKHAESLYYTSENGVTIFKKDFEIKSAKLLYYKKPLQIDLPGYIKINGEESQTVDPDLQEKALLDIAVMIAKSIAGANENATAFQVLTNVQQTGK